MIPLASFVNVEVQLPQVRLQFAAAKERADRVLKLILPEVIEARREFESRNEPEFEI